LCYLKEQRYISNRLLASEKSSKSALGLISGISKISVIIGTVVILITVGILSGFKSQILKGLSGFNGHISISSYASLQGNLDSKLSITPAIQSVLDRYKNSATSVILKNGIVKASENVEGCLLKGVDHYSDYTQQIIKSGNIPELDESHIKEILISEKLSEKLNVKVGQKILCYFIIARESDTAETVTYQYKVRDLIIKGIYATGFEEIDSKTILCNINLLKRLELNRSSSYSVAPNAELNDYVTEIEIADNSRDLNEKLQKINEQLNANEIAISLEEKYGNIFLWLSLLDNNAVIIIVLMIIVAVINMISAVIVLIIENVNNIGLLKALGAYNRQINRLFFFNIFKKIVKYVVYGNIIGLSLLFIQYFLHIIPLDPDTYYVDFVPVKIDWLSVVGLSALIIFSCVLFTLLPLLIIMRIKPSTILKFS
jgi:lipoprotein-releasing system permease protein